MLNLHKIIILKQHEVFFEPTSVFDVFSILK